MIQAWSGWRRYRKLSAHWRNIVFYSESGQDWHYFAPLIEVLNADLQHKVTYVTSDKNDPGLNQQHDLFTAICIPAGFFLTLFFNMQKADVMGLTMMDLDNLQLKKSIKALAVIEPADELKQRLRRFYRCLGGDFDRIRNKLRVDAVTIETLDSGEQCRRRRH